MKAFVGLMTLAQVRKAGTTGSGGAQQQNLAVVALVEKQASHADLYETDEHQFADDGDEHAARGSAEPAHCCRNQQQHE
jgi:hypothetical protein